MNLERAHSIYFIGIGGIGMSALARWFKRMGKFIAGYDRTETPLTRKIASEGIEVNYEDTPEVIPSEIRSDRKDVMIVYTPAIPAENSILNYFIQHKYKLKKRSEVLGEISSNHYTIAVAGTHGKTTTSALIAHILKEANFNMTGFLGGVLTNYDSNLVVNEEPDKPLRIVLEADEFDRSFLTLHPDIAVVTAIDPDHLDIYGDVTEMERGFREFVHKIRHNGVLVVHKGLEEKVLPEDRPDLKVMVYGLNHIPIRSEEIRMNEDEVRFTYHSPKTIIENIPFALPGFHNIENAIAAITVCLRMGVDGSVIKSAVSNFRGIKRRFEFILYTDRLVFIDDYAHHPEEIKALLSSLRAMYDGRKVTVVFQPHLFSRTKDFAAEFAGALDLADEVILLGIYPAREQPLAGVTSELIASRMLLENKMIVDKLNLINELGERDLDILVTVGAGDIDQLVDPIKNMLETKYEISED